MESMHTEHTEDVQISDLLNTLPPELLISILAFISPKQSKLELSCVCKYMRVLISDDKLWKDYCYQSFPLDDYYVGERFSSWHFLYGELGTTMKWNKEMCSSNLSIVNKGYSVLCNVDRDAPHFMVALASQNGISSNAYFEVKIISLTKEHSELFNYIKYGGGEAQIGVGIATKSVNMNRFLGFDYCGGAYFNDGSMGYGSTTIPFAASFTAGDVVGVLVDYRRRVLEFFLNGISMGSPYTNLPREIFYPAVCLRVKGDCTMLNLRPVCPVELPTNVKSVLGYATM